MRIDHQISPITSTSASQHELHGFSVELHEAREHLIATFHRLPSGCREHVLSDEETGPRTRRYWSYEGLERCYLRLRGYGAEHPSSEVSGLVEAAREARRRMNRAREALITGNLGIVPHVVKEFYSGTIPLNDLIQEGYIGLLRAVDRFDPTRGVKFSTYAGWWIRRSLGDAFTDRARLIRLPESIRRELRRLREATRELKEDLSRTPTDREVAEKTGLSLRKLKRLRQVAPDPYCLEDLASNRDDGWQAIIAETGASDPFEATLKGELQEQAARALEQLNPRERRVIEMRFGFEDDQGMTLQQIAQLLGVSRERVRQIESAALDRIARWAKRARVASC